MPLIKNDKQTTIAKETNNRVIAKLINLKQIISQQERYVMIATLPDMIDQINVNFVDDPDELIQEKMFYVAEVVLASHKDEAKNKVLEKFVTSIIKKIVQIYAIRTRRVDSLSYIIKLMGKKGPLFYKQYSKIISFGYASDRDVNNFYHQCVGVTLKQLQRFNKIVWQLALKDIIDLVHFINNVQYDPLHNTEGIELLESLCSELLAYFKSGRPQLVKFCNSITSMKTLEQYLLRKLDSKSSLGKFIVELGPSLAQNFLQRPEYDLRKAGLNLMEAYIDQYSYDTYNSKFKQSEWKAWIRKHQIYELVLSDVAFCEEVIDKNSTFFRYLKRYKTDQQRITMLIGILNKNIKSDKLASYIAKQLDCYFLDSKAKQIIFEYFNSFPTFVNAPLEYVSILQELPARSEGDLFTEKVYNLTLRIMKTDFEKMPDNYRTRYLSTFKSLFNKYYSIYKFKGAEIKQKILKDMMLDFLIDISTIKILLFNVTIIDGQMWKALSNSNFQNSLTEIVDKHQFFDNIFKYLEAQPISKMSEKEFVKIIKFVSNKITTKHDAVYRYINVISKFPDIFEELIANSSYAQLEDHMRKLITLFKQNPGTPFHILTITFEKINHNSFSQYMKCPSLLKDKKQDKSLTKSPKHLKFYDEIVELILETDHEGLRKELCEFIVSLYVNHKQNKSFAYNDNGEQTFITFLTDLLDHFIQDYQQFVINPSSLKTLLVGLELIQKALEFTDILGYGVFKPHKSLVSTSTILLTVFNNVTFGDDVAKTIHRDFPSNMTLFEALTIIGLAFKCGPEDIVLKQKGRFIPSIYNAHSLEDLKLTNDQIIAEQNSANSLQTPEVVESKEYDSKAKGKVKPQMIKIITDVFNRFAYDGKMSLLECTNYVRRASGSQCISSDRRVKEVFECDSDNDNIITLSDFIEYYTKNLTYMTYYKEQMLKGLFNLRYRKNLTLYNEPLDISNQYYLMMRFKIAKNYHNIYDILFQLSSHDNKSLSDKAKSLLLYLPSNPQLKSEIAKPISFSSCTQFEIYYKLISIQNVLNTVQQKDKIFEAKLAKIEAFVNNKNHQMIFKLLCKYHLKPQKTQFESKSMLICLRILRSLINIDYLPTVNIYTCKFDKIFIPPLPSTIYFAEHNALAYNSRNIINYETLLVLQLTQQNVNLKSIIECCFSPEEDIRKISCSFIYLWSLKTKFSYDLFQIPISEKDNEQWFELLCGIIRQNPAIDLKFLKNIAISILKERQQTFKNQYDHLMNGYLKILLSISARQKIISPDTEQQFVRLLNNSLSQKNRTLIFELIRMEKREIGYDYFDRMLSNILPSQECLMRQRYVGIKNLGAICYINSILQQFFMIEKFRHMVLSRNVPKDVQSVEVNGKMIVDDFMYQLQKLYHHLQYSQKKYIIPKQFCYAFKNFQGQPINTSIQEDAHQFLNRLIESAEQAFKKQNQLNEFEKILTIKKLTQIQCEVCKNRIDKYENDSCLMLEVKNHDNLMDSLRKFTEQEEISDYFCEKCNKKMNKIYKRTYLNELPQIVVLNLQRIIYDQSKGEKVKVHTQLSFPQEINFSEFIKNDNPTMQTNYSLKGVVIHTGTSQGGHYYSIIKTNNQGWFKFNDHTVIPFDQKDIQRETFGGFQSKDGWGEITYSTNAYILFYERSNMKPQEFIEVQNEFTEELHKENVRLINQLQVHQESFFKAIIASYDSVRPANLDDIRKTHPYMPEKPSKDLEREYLELIKITQKAFSFLNVYTEIKQEIRVRMGVILGELYYIVPEQTATFFKECNINTYIQNIISNSTNNQRQTLKSALVELLLIHCRYYDIEFSVSSEKNEFIVDILEKILSYLQSKLFYSNITKIGSYLSFWEILMKNGKDACYFLLQRHYFFRLLDLLMGKESPFMKYHPVAQDLPVNIVPYVWNSIDCLLSYKMNLKGIKILENSAVPTSSLQGAILTNPIFYKRIMRLKYDHHSLSNIICYYSTGDIDFSAIIADFLINFLNNKDQIIDIPLFFKHISDFLLIHDKLETIRYGWVLGIPQNKQTAIDEYCLAYSDRSESFRYISGINYKKPIGENHRKPLLELAYERKALDCVAHIYCLKVLLELVIDNEKTFQFVMRLPPPTYHMKNYFEWIGTYLGLISKDADAIFEKKTEILTALNSMLEIAIEKARTSEYPLPQKYIIGKTKQIELIGKISSKGYEATLMRLITYVLDNKPTGDYNDSMAKRFFNSQDPKGIGHAFIHHRSKSYFETEANELERMETLYVLSGKTQERYSLAFKGNQFKYHIVLAEGEFSIVFPYEKQEEIKDLVNIMPLPDYRVEVMGEQLEKVFIIEKEEKMEEEKGDFNPAVPAAPAFVEPKIKCNFCTYDNELTSERCDMCDNLLFT